MNSFFFNKLKFKFPIKLFANEHFFLKKSYIIIKYLYFNMLFTSSFFKSIKYVNNSYYTILQLFCRIRKNTILTRNNLFHSTRKLYPQKGLGKARSGSLKSPLRRGGSIIFGPITKTLDIVLHTKRKKLSFFYLVLNKRTYISFIFISPVIHNFINIDEYLNQQKRINGLFSLRLVYVLLYKIKYIIKGGYSLIYINSLNFNHLLKSDHIIFLI